MADKLKELLGEDVYNEHIAPKLGTEKKYFFGEGDFIPKGRFDEVNTQAKDYKTQIEQRDNQLAELQKQAKGNEELIAQIEALKTENKSKLDEYEARIKTREKEFEIDTLLISSGAKNVRAVKGLLDLEKDAKEQIEALKKSDSYLFNVSKINDENGLDPKKDKQTNDKDEFADFRKFR